MDSLVYLNKYHGEFVNKTGDGYILPVVDLDRLRKTAPKNGGDSILGKSCRDSQINILNSIKRTTQKKKQ